VTLAGLTRGSIAAAIAAVALVMLGSAVPMHVAQLDTYAIRIWRLLDETPTSEHARVWLAAWPLVFIAVAAGVGFGWRISALDEQGGVSATRMRGGPGLLSTPGLLTLGAWTASVVIPAALMAASVHSARSVATFWRVSGDSILQSAGIAAATGAACAAIACATWAGLSAGGWVLAGTRLCVALLLAGGLMPGVLIGAATAEAWNTGPLHWVGDTWVIVVLGHVARFGFLGALLGVWMARSEPEDERRLRAIDVGGSLRGWARAALPPQGGVLAAGSIAAGLLSFHEIEAGVVLQPPGLDSFARQMLQLLHFARTEELSAGVLIVLGIGTVAAGACVALASVGRK
jgi:ABC-type spermidine/putrescine transport system permease subunit II